MAESPLLLTSSAHMPPAPAWLISYSIKQHGYLRTQQWNAECIWIIPVTCDKSLEDQ